MPIRGGKVGPKGAAGGRAQLRGWPLRRGRAGTAGFVSRPSRVLTSRLSSGLRERALKCVIPFSLSFFILPPIAKEKGEKKLFGFSFVPLMQEDGRTLPDGTHELIVHKVTRVGGGWWRRKVTRDSLSWPRRPGGSAPGILGAGRPPF